MDLLPPQPPAGSDDQLSQPSLRIRMVQTREQAYNSSLPFPINELGPAMCTTLGEPTQAIYVVHIAPLLLPPRTAGT